jgi:hypothetical protein
MNIPLALPDWVPGWVPLVLLVPALLYALAFLFMPFSVLGLKSRLEILEARLDEIQNEIRLLALRLPASPREVDFEDVYAPIAAPVSRRTPPAPERPAVPERPPIPPAAYDRPTARDHYEEDDEDGPVEREAPPPHMRPVRRLDSPAVVRPERQEPRFDRRR